MTAYPHEFLSRLAPLGALLAALVLAGCGVKGGLEPPPGSQPPAPQAKAEPVSTQPPDAPRGEATKRATR